jgi:hypothetical protein
MSPYTCHQHTQQLLLATVLSTVCSHPFPATAGCTGTAGGVSITPALAVLQQLAAAAASSGAAPLPILLVLSFRHAHELEVLCPLLLTMARALGLSLTPKLYYTGACACNHCCWPMLIVLLHENVLC